MAVTSGFFNSVTGDRKYNATHMSELFDGILNDGVFASIGTSMVVAASTGMTVLVGIGRAWFNRTWTYNDADLPLVVTASELVLNRLDAVVLEVNSSTNVRENTVKIVNGTPAASPSAPAMIQTDDIHQYPLAYIYVGAGVTSIIQQNITNKVGSAACPFVTGIIQSVTVEGITAILEARFNTWFDNIQTQLGGDVVGNFQLQLDEIHDFIVDVGIELTEPVGKYHLELFQLTDERLANTIIPVTSPLYFPNTVSDLQDMIPKGGRLDIDGGNAYWKSGDKEYSKINLSTFQKTVVDVSSLLNASTDSLLCVDENYIFWWRTVTLSSQDANSTGYLKRTTHNLATTTTSALLTVGYCQSVTGGGNIVYYGPQTHSTIYQSKECIVTNKSSGGIYWPDVGAPAQAICFNKNDLTLIYRNTSYVGATCLNLSYDMNYMNYKTGSLSPYFANMRPTTWSSVSVPIDGSSCQRLIQYAKLGPNQYLCSWYRIDSATQYWGILNNIPGNAITSTGKVQFSGSQLTNINV